jgi:prevent-host-death family protein
MCYSMTHMAVRAGIRELRQNLSRYVERVKEGETIEVTERGRLVARLTPATDTASAIAALEELGLAVRAPSLDFSSLGPARPPRTGEPLPSELLAEDRAGGRY